jgi:hypothetical protein
MLASPSHDALQVVPDPSDIHIEEFLHDASVQVYSEIGIRGDN